MAFKFRYGTNRYLAPTIGDIMNSLISVGLQVAKVLEPEPPESWRDNERQNDAFRIPEFLVLVCKKG